jgi:hypothetical protein
MRGSACRLARPTKLIAPTGEEHITVDEEPTGALSRERREHRLEIHLSGGPHDQDLHTNRAPRFLHGCRITLGIGVIRIDQHRNGLGRWYQLMQKPELLRR